MPTLASLVARWPVGAFPLALVAQKWHDAGMPSARYTIEVEVLVDAPHVPGVTAIYAAPFLRGRVLAPRWKCVPTVDVVVTATEVVATTVGVELPEDGALVSVVDAWRLLTAVQPIGAWAEAIAEEAAAQRARELWRERDPNSPAAPALFEQLFRQGARRAMARQPRHPDDPQQLAQAAELWREQIAGKRTGSSVAAELGVSLRTAYRLRDRATAAGLLDTSERTTP